MENEIKRNLVFLIENLTDLTRVLAYLIQSDIISIAESEEIDAEPTPTRRTSQLLSTLLRKNWSEIRNAFLDILCKTNNEICAQAIQEKKEKYLFPLSSSSVIMENEIKKNMVFMTDNLTDLTRVLVYLIQAKIISEDELQEIDSGSTLTTKNYKLLSTLQKKNWEEIRNTFLEILRKTNNEACAEIIQGANQSDLFRPSSPTNIENVFDTLQDRNAQSVKMENEIQQNIVFMAENLTNLPVVLTHLIQLDIISEYERNEIYEEKSSTRRNYKLLSTLQKKDWEKIRRLFLDILLKTNNEHCAQTIKKRLDYHILSHSSATNTNNNFFPRLIKNFLFHPKINQKWWPDKKLLIKSLLKRKHGEELLIDELNNRMSRDENRMLVICESPAASKYSGMGGVGKTLTAKWYAHTYELEYDHIIWIDCGEGSLLTSFAKLARDLEIKSFDNFSLTEMATKIFGQLTPFRCLWIYDNAEYYKGQDGIINFLPKCEKNFHCIITSRSREWGMENVGYGKITALELDIFTEEESLEFLRSTLYSSIPSTNSQLRELCRLMGNLPFALQLATAALNNKKIELQNYIEKTSSNDLGNILDEKFDDYEKTINANIKISLDLISKQEKGKLAYELLMIFGYIRPDDIRSLFLMKVLNIESSSMEQAINLLEKYSLITKTGKVLEYPYKEGIINKLLRKNEIAVEMYLLSIHRLLQQVIRHNGRETEEQTLKKILSCVGFIDYKFIPFTKYADQKLQKTFPNIRAELLDQRQLRKLIKEERHEEAVQLARFIWVELKTKSSKLMYAVCLYKNGQEEECVEILNDLYLEIMWKIKENFWTKILRSMLNYIRTVHEIRITLRKGLNFLEPKENLTDEDIGEILFCYYLGVGKINEALKIRHVANETHIITILYETIKQRRFEESAQLARIIAEELKTQATKFNHAICLARNEQFKESVSILKQLGKEEMKETRLYREDSVNMGILKFKEELSKDLINGHLFVIFWKMNNISCIKKLMETQKKFKIIHSVESLGILIQIVNSELTTTNFSLRMGYHDSIIALKLNGSTSKIDLNSCTFDFFNFDRIASEELALCNVIFTKNGRELEEVTINEILDLEKINKLSLNYDDNMKICISIDLKSDNSMEYLHLMNVRVISWESANWDVIRLELRCINFVEKTKMKIKELKVSQSYLDLSCLPNTIEKLHLHRVNVICNAPIDLPTLKYLTLECMPDDSYTLQSFQSINIAYIYFDWVKELNVDQIPNCVTHVKISNRNITDLIVFGGVRRMDKLILQDFSFKETEELLIHFQTDELVVEFGYDITSRELMILLNKEIKRIAVGTLNWNKKKFSTISSYVDKKADFYLWEGGKGRGIEKEEFKELKLLY